MRGEQGLCRRDRRGSHARGRYVAFADPRDVYLTKSQSGRDHTWVDRKGVGDLRGSQPEAFYLSVHLPQPIVGHDAGADDVLIYSLILQDDLHPAGSRVWLPISSIAIDEWGRLVSIIVLTRV